jgi:large subunit ribosomal protein L29
MKANELRTKSGEELQARLLEMRRKQFNMRMEAGSGQTPRASEIREARREIARIKTIVNERRQGGAE